MSAGGRVGVPHYAAIPAAQPAFFNNISVRGLQATVERMLIDRCVQHVPEREGGDIGLPEND